MRARKQTYEVSVELRASAPDNLRKHYSHKHVDGEVVIAEELSTFLVPDMAESIGLESAIDVTEEGKVGECLSLATRHLDL